MAIKESKINSNLNLKIFDKSKIEMNWKYDSKKLFKIFF